MRPTAISLLAALTLSASAALAQSGGSVTFLPDPTVAGRYTATFEATHLSAGAFVDVYDLVPPVDGFLSFSLDSVGPLGPAGAFFQGYQLNGGPITFFDNSQSHVTVEGIQFAGGQSLLIAGVAAPAEVPRQPVTAQYIATFTVDAVPEPQTWLLMAGGLLALGAVATPRRTAASAAARR